MKKVVTVQVTFDDDGNKSGKNEPDADRLEALEADIAAYINKWHNRYHFAASCEVKEIYTENDAGECIRHWKKGE